MRVFFLCAIYCIVYKVFGTSLKIIEYVHFSQNEKKNRKPQKHNANALTFTFIFILKGRIPSRPFFFFFCKKYRNASVFVFFFFFCFFFYYPSLFHRIRSNGLGISMD